MDKKQTQKLLMMLPIGSIFTLNGVVYKKMDGYYATQGYKENYEGYVKKVPFDKLNITIRANCLTVSLR
jgi:hypothetical protein